MRYWRDILSRSPLPLLALSASYGVYSFALLSVPEWVAGIQAVAFDATYIGLSVVQNLNDAQRKRATAISIGAVAVSIIYNSLAALFHRNPSWLIDLAWYYEVILAILHGAPLALVAYCVADLLLHTPMNPQEAPRAARVPGLHEGLMTIAEDFDEPLVIVEESKKRRGRKMISAPGQTGKKVQVVELLKQEPALETSEIAREVGVSPQYVRKLRSEVKTI